MKEAYDLRKLTGELTYLLSAAYAERGYCGAKVEIKQAGTKRLLRWHIGV
jgi:hypothetical protein